MRRLPLFLCLSLSLLLPACAGLEADARRREALRFMPEPDRARLITVASQLLEEDGYSVTVHGDPDDILDRLLGTPTKLWILEADKTITTTTPDPDGHMPLWQLALGERPTITTVSTLHVQALIEPKPGGFDIRTSGGPTDSVVMMLQAPDGSSPPRPYYGEWDEVFLMRLKAALADHRLDAPAPLPSAPSGPAPAALPAPQHHPSRSAQLYGNPKPDALLDP
jgi:hypothetical protein